MDTLQKYTKLKREEEVARQQADKAEGALGEVMGQIKKEFGCTTLKLAKIELIKRKKQAANSKEKFDDAVEEYEEKWEGEE